MVREAGQKCPASAFTIILCTAAIVTGLSATGCSDGARLERWESARHAAFSAFRDNKFDQAIEKYNAAVAIGREFGAADVHVAMALTELAHVYAAQDKVPDAGRTFAEAVAIFAKIPQNRMPPDVVLSHCDALEGLAVCDEKQGRVQECDNHFRQALYAATQAGLRSKVQDITFEYNSFKNDHAMPTDTVNTSTVTGKFAVDEKQSALNEKYSSLFSEGQSAYKAKKFDLAEQKFLDASTVAEKLRSRTGQANCATKLGAVYNSKDDLQKSEKCYRFAEHLYEHSQVGSDAGDKECLQGLCAVLVRESKGLEATECAQKLVDMARAHHSVDDREIIEAEGNLATACMTAGRFDRAIESFKRSEALAITHHPVCSPEVIMYSCWISRLYFLAGQFPEGQNKLAELVLKMEDQPPANLSLPARLLNDYGEEMIKEGHWGDSPPYFKAAAAMLVKAPDERLERGRAERHLKELIPRIQRFLQQQKKDKAAHKT